MSVPSPKGKKLSPISGLKPGPLKATLPVASLMRAESDFTTYQSSSPTTTLKNRFSPDCRLSGQRSPGSLSYKGFRSKERSSTVGSPISCSIRRTASLDAIYLKGQWPTEAFYMHLGTLQVDKATQTDEVWSERKARQSESGSDDLKFEKYLKHRLRTGRTQGLGLRLISPPIAGDPSVTPPHTGTPPYPSHEGMHSPVQPLHLNMPARQPLTRPPIRGSLEGLNQEIERLVLKDFEDKIVTYGSIPEGHRAPLADMLRHKRSVNTQTPGGTDDMDVDFGSSGPPSRGSLSPQYYMELALHCNRTESCGSSPDDATRPGTSPHINRFLAREPPDGCEKVSLRLEEGRKGEGLPPLKPITKGLFKPSLGSAFQPLQAAPVDPALLNGECSKMGNQSSPSPQNSD